MLLYSLTLDDEYQGYIIRKKIWFILWWIKIYTSGIINMKRNSCGRKYISIKFKIYFFFESCIIIRYILPWIFKLISTSE